MDKRIEKYLVLQEKIKNMAENGITEIRMYDLIITGLSFQLEDMKEENDKR